MTDETPDIPEQPTNQPPATPAESSIDAAEVAPTPSAAQTTAEMGSVNEVRAPGPAIASSSLVAVVVSRGPSAEAQSAVIAMPDAIGVPQGDALAQLQAAGLSAQVFTDYSSATAKGRVIGQLPEGGTNTAAGSAAVLMVSNGPATQPIAPVSLPDVVGLTEAASLSKLQAVGLVPKVVREYSPNIPEGVVVAQLPSARSLAQVPPKRSLIWLWALIALAVLLLFGGLWMMNRNQSEPASVAETTETVAATSTPKPEPAPTVAAVPNVVGQTQAAAESALKAAGFVPTVAKVTTNDNPAGTVVAQVPGADKELTIGSQVAIEVAQAAAPPKPSQVTVPNVVGMTQANAQNALLAADLAPSFVMQANSAPKGQAFSQQPVGGDSVAPGTVIIVAISTGTPPAPSTVAVPGVIGKTKDAAVSAISGAKLTSQVVQAYSATAPKGQVFQQWPASGTQVAPGTVVDIVVSMGKEPTNGTTVKVPNVTGMTADAAMQALADVGLEAQTVEIADPQATEGEVVGQLPKADSSVPVGSTVLIGVAGPAAVQH